MSQSSKRFSRLLKVKLSNFASLALLERKRLKLIKTTMNLNIHNLGSNVFECQIEVLGRKALIWIRCKLPPGRRASTGFAANRLP